MNKKTLQILVGPNGSGKSKDLNLITRGEIEKLSFLSPHLFSRNISCGYFKQSSLTSYFSKRVYSNLVVPYLLNQPSNDKINYFKNISKFLKYFNFEYLLNLDISSLSGGELKIIRLLSELLLNRPYFIMDDPFSALDSVRINSLNSIINNILTNNEEGLDNLKHLIISTVDSQRKNIPPISYSQSNKVEIILSEDVKRKERWIEFITSGLFPNERVSIGDIIVADLLFKIKVQKRKLLKNSTYKFEANKLNVIHCPNGSGKTLLLNSIVGYFPKGCEILSGNILFKNSNSQFTFKEWIFSKKYRTIRDRIMYVPQNSEFLLACYSPRTLIERIFIDLGHDKRLSTIAPFIDDLFDDRQMNEHSVGEVRFYGILFACIIALLNSNVKIVILDEPDSYLDIKNQELLILLFRKLLDSNILIVISSHNYKKYIKIPNNMINFN